MKSFLPVCFVATQLLTSLAFGQQPTFKTGINFPFYLPDVVRITNYLNLIQQSGAKSIRQMTFADVHWNNVEATDNTWTFVRTDSAFFNTFGLTPIGTLYSMMGDDEVGLQTPWLACTNPFTCFWDPAGDSVYAKDYVLTTVNRYKSVTKYWEIANEIEHTLPPQGLPNLISQKNFLKYNYRWIKTADPTAKVLLPGLLGTCCSYPMSNSFTWLRNLLAIGGGDYFDVMNYHDYNAWWTLPAHYDSVKNILNQFSLTKPIWITETSISSANISPITPSYSSADEQAADVWRRICLLWAKGAQVVLWHTGWSNADMTGWGEFGIISNSGSKKKSFHAYKLLNEKLGNYTSVNLVSTGTVTDNNSSGGNGIWVIRFVVDGTQKWVLWSPNNQPYTLSGISTNGLTVTSVVPASLLNNGENASFQTNTYAASASGTYTFTQLPKYPVIAEEAEVTALETHVPASFISVYPNPAQSYAVITIPDTTSEYIPFEIIDGTGKVVLSEAKPVTENQMIIELAGLNKGFYFIKLRIANTVVVKKLIRN